MTGKLAAVTANLTRGFHLHPLVGKKPFWTDFPNVATNDIAKLRPWFEDNDHNIGIATNGLIVVDFDYDKPGSKAAEFERLQDMLYGWPETYTVRTASGGRHRYYRAPPGSDYRSTQSRLDACVDTRGNRGNIVAAGSVIDGKAYTVEVDAPIADAPAWLLALLREHKPDPNRDIPVEGAGGPADVAAFTAYLRKVDLTTGMWEIGCEGHDYGIPLEDAIPLVDKIVNEERDGGWSFDDTALKLGNAYTHAQNRFGSKSIAADGFRNRSADVLPAQQPERAGNDKPLLIGSDIELAEAALQKLGPAGNDVVHDDGRFWQFGGKAWEQVDPEAIRRLLHTFDGAQYGSTGRVKLGMAKINSIMREMAAMAARQGFFADAPAGINCASGFITFAKDGTPSQAPHHRDQRARHVLPGCWSPNTAWRIPGSLIERLIAAPFAGDPDAEQKIGLLAEVFGAAASGYATRLIAAKAIVLYGAQAGNGKSEILAAMRALLPAGAVASVPPGKFSDERHVVVLMGKLLNAADELTSAHAIASDTFKSLITGEPVSARDMYKTAMSFRAQALHCYATNALPPFRGGFDKGVQRRLLVIPFNRVIPEAERIEHIGTRVGTDEPDLLLAFAIEGAARLIKRRQFDEPAACRAELKNWMLSADPVAAWLEHRVVFEPGARLYTRDAMADFQNWAAGQGFSRQHLPAVNVLCQRMKAQDSRIGEAHRGDAGGRFYTGARLASDFEFTRPTHSVQAWDAGIFG